MYSNKIGDNAEVYRASLGEWQVYKKVGTEVHLSADRSQKITAANNNSTIEAHSRTVLVLNLATQTISEALSYEAFGEEDYRLVTRRTFSYKSSKGLSLLTNVILESTLAQAYPDMSDGALVGITKTIDYEWLQVNNDDFEFPDPFKLLNNEKAVEKLLESPKK